MKKELKKHGFTVTGNKKDGYEAQQSTPAGEDWWITFSDKENLMDYCLYYPKEEELEMLIKSDIQGKPSIKTLVEDADWKEQKLKDVLVELMR